MFNPALLPGGVRVAEKGLDAEGMEVVMAGELRAIVEGDGLPAVGGRSAAVGDGTAVREQGGGAAAAAFAFSLGMRVGRFNFVRFLNSAEPTFARPLRSD